mgnify:CR=1 FL=1
MRLLTLLAIVAIIATVFVSGSDASPKGPAPVAVGVKATVLASKVAQPKPTIVATTTVATVAVAKPLPKVTKKPALPPCKKAKKAKLLSIEQRYPTLVKDYHPIDDAVNPNAISGREADRVARVIIREHLEWERENPEPPRQMSTEELKEMGLKLAEETRAIEKEQKEFKALSKFVDDDHAAYEAAEKARVAKAAEAEKQKQKDAEEKTKTEAMLKEVEEKRAAVAEQKAANDEARAAAKKASDAKTGAKLTKPTAASTKIQALKAKATAK